MGEGSGLSSSEGNLCENLRKLRETYDCVRDFRGIKIPGLSFTLKTPMHEFLNSVSSGS